jgi:hypothetical protein
MHIQSMASICQVTKYITLRTTYIGVHKIQATVNLIKYFTEGFFLEYLLDFRLIKSKQVFIKTGYSVCK